MLHGMMTECEDGPPPLEDMSRFLHKMSSTKENATDEERKCVKRDKSSLLDDSFSYPAANLIKESEENIPTPSTKEDEFLKPGFLNNATHSAKKKDVPFLKAKSSNKKDIPDFMHVSSPLDKYREELTSMLKPTQDIVKEVLDNDGIKNGLDDPEILAAVQDIANDYSAIKKYRSNPKVTAFYSQLGKLMGDKLEKQTTDNNK